MSGQRHSQSTPSSLGQGCMSVRCNQPPALLAERPRVFTCHCGNTVVEQTPNKSRDGLLAERRTRDRKVASSNPGRSGERISSPELTLCADTHSSTQ